MMFFREKSAVVYISTSFVTLDEVEVFADAIFNSQLYSCILSVNT
jgi:hypothetical protein